MINIIFLSSWCEYWSVQWEICHTYCTRCYHNSSGCTLLLVWLIVWWPHDLGLLHRGIGHAITYNIYLFRKPKGNLVPMNLFPSNLIFSRKNSSK